MSIRIPIITDFDGKGILKAAKQFSELETNGQKAQFALQKAAVPAAAALAGVAAAAGFAVKAAMEDQQAQQNLARQLRTTTGATDAAIKANEDFITRMSMSSATADDDLRPALQSLVVGTGNLTTAQNMLKTALDVSAATGKDLATVSDALSKGYSGNTRALVALSPEIKAMIKNGASFDDVLKQLKTNFGGASQAAANTAAGGFKRMTISLNEAKESIGAALLPVAEKLAAFLTKLAMFAQANSGLVAGLAAAIGTFAAVIVTANIAMNAWKAISVITTAVNLALATSFTAVQIATGVGIVTAIAAAGVWMKLKDTYKQTGTAVADLNNKTVTFVSTQKQLNEFMGPVASRNLAELNKFLDEYKKSQSAAAKAAEAAKERLQKFHDTIKNAKNSLKEYAQGIASSVSGFANLSRAVTESKDREQAYNDALAERKDAYAELAKLSADEKTSTEALAAAKERVAKAESAVTATQNQRKSYSTIFAEQITAAKEFAGRLQTLVKMGLSRAGIAQLMDLGPVAGSQMATDLIAGTAGMTVQTLNADLTSLETAGMALGTDIIAGDMGVLNQAAGRKFSPNQQITINVNGGDPQAVVNALRRYMQQNGSVPIRVSG